MTITGLSQNPVVLRSAQPPAIPPLDIGGFHIIGVNPQAIVEGEFRLHVPLVMGRHFLPAVYQDAEAIVRRDAAVDIKISIVRGEDNLPVISAVHIGFNPSLIIDNPVEAFQPPPSNDFLRWIHWDEIQDLIADLDIHGANIDAQGKIHMVGNLDKGILGTQPLEELMTPEQLPTIDLHIGRLLLDALKQSNAHAQRSVTAFNLPVFLSRLGGMTERASFGLDIKTDDMSLDISREGLHVLTDKGPVTVHLEGHARLYSSGDLDLTGDQSTSTITSGIGRVALGGEARFDKITSGNPDIITRIGVKADIGGVMGELDASGAHVPFTVKPHEAQISAQIFLRRTKSGEIDVMKATTGKADVKIETLDGAQVHVGDLSVVLQSGNVQTNIAANGGYDKTGLSIDDGRAKVSVNTSEPKLAIDDFKCKVNGIVDATIDAHNIHVTPEEGASAQGVISYGIAPTPAWSAAFPELRPVYREGNFSLKPGGNLEVDPALTGDVAEVVAPFIDFSKKEEDDKK